MGTTRVGGGRKPTAKDPSLLRNRAGLKFLPPAKARAFLGLIRAGECLSRELSSELEREHRISLRGFEVLLFLAVFSDSGEMRISELTERAPLSQSRVSRLIAELEKDELVKRSSVAEDGRGVTVAITEKGLQRFKEAQETHVDGLNRLLFSHISREEIETITSVTERIMSACEPTR